MRSDSVELLKAPHFRGMVNILQNAPTSEETRDLKLLQMHTKQLNDGLLLVLFCFKASHFEWPHKRCDAALRKKRGAEQVYRLHRNTRRALHLLRIERKRHCFLLGGTG